MPRPAAAPPEEPPRESDEDRLRFILEGQLHCDYFLAPLADPRGKSVLVVGAGAGTEMLWCLREGAREVVGIDILAQRPAALEQAVAALGLAPAPPCSLLRLDVEEAVSLGRCFDLVLSNNVFEHVADPGRALAACAALVEPGTGRIAIFTAPLYYSSAGSHLPVEPWAHLWQDPETLRRDLLGELPPRHALEVLDLPDYLDREISLNRARLADLLAAVRANDLVVVNLRVLADRSLARLPTYLPRLAPLCGERGVAVTDLAVEGIALELMRPGDHPLDAPITATEERRRARRREDLEERMKSLDDRVRELEAENARLAGQLDTLRREREYHRAEIERQRRAVVEVKRVLDSVAASWSFRLGRALTAPVRWLRPRR